MIRLRSASGKEAEVERLLRRCSPLAQDEPGTVSWFGMRFDSTTFGIFAAFQSQAGLDRYLSDHLTLVLEAVTSQILAEPFLVEQIEIIEAKT